ncbi:hypothetical protein PROFUN_12546 [Planoprotostelium fungivorum]|uniref:Uncharacterized protein n=1 Tax=Planoprotostelium fungivorum TaxID=1890364 RepID=A0A2P6N760_9EUKA|nr:hypothetical protein PROFUN_12546 [Planoprotostelium fungivorum]
MHHRSAFKSNETERRAERPVTDSGKSFSAQHAKEQANNSFTATTTMEHPHLDLD